MGHCEIDKYAEASYRAIYEPGEEEKYYTDIRTIDPNELPDFDLLCGGFPCQAFSNAGRRRGFEDTRGTLFFEITRLARARRPSYLFLENVPGLLSHDKGRTFSVILTTLSELGYRVEWMVLNSKNFGVPQSRRRVFLICYLDPRCAGEILPIFSTGGKTVISPGTEGQVSRHSVTRKIGAKGDVLHIKEATKKGYQEAMPGDSVDLGYAGSNTRRGRVGHDVAHTLETSCIQGIVERGRRIRRLMPRECLRLQGFAEWQIDRILSIQSDTQVYKQAGNSVSVPVIETIGRRLRAVDEKLRREDIK